MVGDYYLAHPERFNGQPKRAIAKYVADYGFLTPTIFDSLSEARESGVPTRVRSEHPVEYYGFSGLLSSPELDRYPDVESEEELKEKILSGEDQNKILEEYYKLLGIDKNNFKKGISFSYWEKLGGFNRTVIADPVIEKKYHITTLSADSRFVNYAIIENGKIIKDFLSPLTSDLKESMENLVSLYEHIRHLDRFDPNNCPILEFQTFNKENYFLQYHRGRDFEAPKFSLDREPKDDEIEAFFVRGATPKEGIKCKVALMYAMNISRDWKLPEQEEGSFDLHNNIVFSELMTRARKVQMLNSCNLEQALLKLSSGHLSISTLFEPQISIVLDMKKLMKTSDEYDKMKEDYFENPRDMYLQLYAISDGRKAYVKRL